ncbi:hypothetical protein HPB51_008279 [Rhipicephalus microplus]|uniref:Uncharacterized protein n=1 Tax=Rhipicephalus microplus TaxID=6941 RepID=A0A9J6EYS9_RHIMP|nr:uncharacterized protein LOC119164964 [Rhipicephalus microplus]KAH8039686.1 hypothetical protein HPB51_008279 [Rhipicephalus microplus]
MIPVAKLQRSTAVKLLLIAAVVFLSAKYSRLTPFDYSTGLFYDTHILIDTPGCKVQLREWHSTDQSASTHRQVCVGREPPVNFDFDRPFLNHARLDNTYGIHSFRDVSCYYAGLDTAADTFASDRRPRPFEKAWRNMTTGIRLDAEYFRLRCLHKANPIYDGLHLVARRSDHPADAKTTSKPKEKHNVLVVSVGASSRSEFERNFRYTADFLRHSLYSHELRGYSAVGSGSFPSAVALLGGMTAGEAWSRSAGSYYDALPLLWNDYKKTGHWTLYIEETPAEGAFVDPVDRGFLRKPTDHYPLAMASRMSAPDETDSSRETDSGISDKQPSMCSGYRLRSKALLDYASELAEAGAARPFFAFINLKDSSRNDTKAHVLDKPLQTFLASLERWNASSETTLVLLSDVGQSHWDTGITEHGMPFCFVKLAPFLVKRYPWAASSLTTNERRLTTPYDVHATLKALATQPGELSLEPTRRGRSLLAPIPADRTCIDASVPKEYCACTDTSNQDSPLASPGTLSLARRALEFINNATSSLPSLKDQCTTLALRRVEHVDEHQSSVISSSTSASTKVLIIVSTVPPAIFSVRARKMTALTNDKAEAGGRSGTNQGHHESEITDVDRIDRYADGDSKCVSLVNFKLRRYCYCKDTARQETS